MLAPSRHLLLPFLLVAAMPAALAAQASAGLAAGARVRVHVVPPGEWHEGTLVRADSQHVVLRTGRMSLSGESLVTIRRTGVRDVHVRGARFGTRKRTVVGALLGTVAGAGLGALVTRAADAGEAEQFAALESSVLLVLGGGVAGAILGATTAPRAWLPAELPPTVGAVPLPAHGGALAAPTPF